MISGRGRAVVNDVEQPVKAGDVIKLPIGCKHTIFADTEIQLTEVQIGEEISVHDKQKHELIRKGVVSDEGYGCKI